MLAALGYIGIAGIALSLATGVIGFLMAVRPYPAYYARCRANGEKPGFLWSTHYLETISPDARRRSARRGILLHAMGLAGALIFFPLVIFNGLAH